MNDAVLAMAAAHPHAPAALLDACCALLQPGQRLAELVVAHPSTRPDTLERALPPGDVTGWSDGVIAAVVARTGDLPARAEPLLDQHDGGPRLAAALATASCGTLAGALDRAIRDPGARYVLVPALLDAPWTTAPQAMALIRALLADPEPWPAVRTWIRSLLTRRVQPLPPDQLDALAAVAGDLRLVDDLQAHALRTVTTGGQPRAAWQHAELDEDERRELLAAAAAQRSPAPAQLWAPGWEHEARLLLDGAGASFLDRLARTAFARPMLTELLSWPYPSLSTGAVAELAERLLDAGPEKARGAHASTGWAYGQVLLSVLTHPAADARTRRRVGEHLAYVVHRDYLGPAGLAVDAWAHGPSDPRACWQSLPTPVACTSPLAPVAHAALTQLLPAFDDPDAATALVGLAETFPGPVGDLFTVARGVGGHRR